jgi:hypothetical protein
MEQITFLYTALGVMDKTDRRYGKGWDEYIAWIQLPHLTEVVSLDGMLNEPLFEPDYGDNDEWNFIHSIQQRQTGFYTSQEYVLRKCKNYDNFNLMRVVISPSHDCKYIVDDDYEFMGYELLDDWFGTSVLTNCDGFNEPILATDINRYGLIDDFLTANEISKRLWENNPQHGHAKTNVIAAWRHKIIGRTKLSR